MSQGSPFQQIAPDVKLGKGVRIFGFTNLYGCEIGDDVKIGTFVEIQKGARIGNRCKISSHTFICEGVELEDEVFVGHNVTFTNDLYPRATNGNGALQDGCGLEMRSHADQTGRFDWLGRDVALRDHGRGTRVGRAPGAW